jgi:rhodanese-related sulfurtransferase
MGITNITALEAFEILDQDEGALLVDVRTQKEWHDVGMPDIQASKLILLSWRLQHDMSINPEFSDILSGKVKLKDTKLIFLCRGGIRSNEAAQVISSYGFKNCYNILDGFEGNKYGAGWKNSDLPHTHQ